MRHRQGRRATPELTRAGRGVRVVLGALLLGAAVLGALRLSHIHSREVMLDSLAHQHRLVAEQTADRLSDLAARIEACTTRVVEDADVDWSDPDLEAVTEMAAAEWRRHFPRTRAGLQLLSAEDFDVRVTTRRPHQHHIPHGAGPAALPCRICVGEGGLLPIVVPVHPGVPDGPVLQIELPLDQLGRHLSRGDEADSVWWAHRESSRLLAAPESEHLGSDLVAAAGACGSSFRSFLDGDGVEDGVGEYCWPQPERHARIGGMEPRAFLGTETVIGVSSSRDRATAPMARSQRWTAATAAGLILTLCSFLLWFTAHSRRLVRRDRAAALSTLEALSSALGARDRYTRFHGENVGIYARELGRRLGLDEGRQEALRTAGALHDLGKIGICDGILNKAGPLEPDEREEMERHTEIGEHILGRLPWAQDLADVAGCHHERMDGGGYPRGLFGDDIPEDARIVAVADVLDALLTERPYRAPMALEKALDIIEDMAGSHLDPVPVAALMEDPAAVVALGKGPRPGQTTSFVRLRPVKKTA